MRPHAVAAPNRLTGSGPAHLGLDALDGDRKVTPQKLLRAARRPVKVVEIDLHAAVATPSPAGLETSLAL